MNAARIHQSDWDTIKDHGARLTQECLGMTPVRTWWWVFNSVGLLTFARPSHRSDMRACISHDTGDMWLSYPRCPLQGPEWSAPLCNR